MEIFEESLQTQNRSFRLEHEWVQVLINLRMKYARSFSGKRHSATVAWNNIVKEMCDLGAPRTITRLRVKKKWMNLIAKYKQLKNEADPKKQNAWPYFEQINRAYSKREVFNGEQRNILPQSTIDPDLKDPTELSEKEKFIRTLIDLRYKHRSLFTGKKYAAQKGWMFIQNYLPSGEKYSINQISKVWHNLVLNYKTLIEKETDHSKITWVHFPQLHEIMSGKNNSNESTRFEFIDQTVSGTKEGCPDDSQNPFENISEIKSDVVPFLTNHMSDEEEWEIEGDPKINLKPKEDNTSLTDILNYMKVQDQKREERMQQLLNVMQEILCHLKK